MAFCVGPGLSEVPVSVTLSLSLSLLWLGPRVTDEAAEVKLLWVATEDWGIEDFVVDAWPAIVCVVDALGLVSVLQIEGLLLTTEEDGVQGVMIRVWKLLR